MHGAKNLNPIITRRTHCPQAGGRCSVTGRLWPFPTGMVKPVGNLPTAEDRRTAPQRGHQPEEPDHACRPKPGWAGSGGSVNRGARFTPGPTWLGHRSPVAGPARDAGTGTAHCPLSGPAGNSGTTDDRIPNAGIILIKPPAQRRMGVKRRLVDQGLWFNAGVIVAPARFSCCMTLFICGTGTAKFDR